MRHRIIQHAGRRFSVKLDDLVWENLEQLAAGAGMRLNQLVSRVVSSAGEGANITGALRQYCLDAALKRVKELERAAEDSRLSGRGVPIALLAEASPSPCLIVGGDHKVRRANPAAREWMGVQEEALIGKSVQHYFQIKAPVPLDEITRQYAAGKLGVFSARMVYVRPGRLVVARARICPGLVPEGAAADSPELTYLIFVDPGRSA